MTDAASSSTTQHSWYALDSSKIETSSTFPPYKGIILGEAQNSTKAIPLVLKDDNALGIDGRIQKASEQLNWTNTTIKGFEMSSAKSSAVKEQFDNLQVSINSVNNCLNDVQFSSLVVKSYVRESTKGLIIDLAGKFDKIEMSKSKKPVLVSFLCKRNVQIQNPVKPVDKFPHLFPK